MKDNIEFKKILQTAFEDDISSVNFTVTVMTKVAKVEAERRSYEPLLSKRTFTVLFISIVMVFGIALFSNLPPIEFQLDLIDPTKLSKLRNQLASSFFLVIIISGFWAMDKLICKPSIDFTK